MIQEIGRLDPGISAFFVVASDPWFVVIGPLGFGVALEIDSSGTTLSSIPFDAFDASGELVHGVNSDANGRIYVSYAGIGVAVLEIFENPPVVNYIQMISGIRDAIDFSIVGDDMYATFGNGLGIVPSFPISPTQAVHWIEAPG
jgi:hypothetical protein